MVLPSSWRFDLAADQPVGPLASDSLIWMAVFASFVINRGSSGHNAALIASSFRFLLNRRRSHIETFAIGRGLYPHGSI